MTSLTQYNRVQVNVEPDQLKRYHKDYSSNMSEDLPQPWATGITGATGIDWCCGTGDRHRGSPLERSGLGKDAQRNLSLANTRSAELWMLSRMP